MKELTTTELRQQIGSLKDEVEKGPIRIIWKEPKPNGKEIYSAILTKEERGQTMGLFSKFRKKGAEAAVEIKKFEKRDLMEALVGASLLVAAADGDIDDDELLKLDKQLQANPCMSAFGPEIGKEVNRFTAMLEAGFRTGKAKILREIKDIATNKEEAEDVFLAAIEMAESDGEVDADEKKILSEIGKILGLSLRDYGLE